MQRTEPTMEYQEFIARIAERAKKNLAHPNNGHRVTAPKLLCLAESQNWRCGYCGIICENTKTQHNSATRDHIIPKTAGGKARWINEIMACRLCNNARSAMHSYRYFKLVCLFGREKAARLGFAENSRKAREYYLRCIRAKD